MNFLFVGIKKSRLLLSKFLGKICCKRLCQGISYSLQYSIFLHVTTFRKSVNAPGTISAFRGKTIDFHSVDSVETSQLLEPRISTIQLSQYVLASPGGIVICTIYIATVYKFHNHFDFIFCLRPPLSTRKSKPGNLKPSFRKIPSHCFILPVVIQARYS